MVKIILNELGIKNCVKYKLAFGDNTPGYNEDDPVIMISDPVTLFEANDFITLNKLTIKDTKYLLLNGHLVGWMRFEETKDENN